MYHNLSIKKGFFTLLSTDRANKVNLKRRIKGNCFLKTARKWVWSQNVVRIYNHYKALIHKLEKVFFRFYIALEEVLDWSKQGGMAR